MGVEMRYLLKLLSAIFGIGGVGLLIWVTVCSFSFWIGIWGGYGALFNIFLFPFALLGYPLVESITSGNWMFMLGYLDIASVYILMTLAGWFGDKAEEIGERAYSQQLYKRPTCPKCGSEMVVRTAKKGPNAGRKFYVCINHPKCKWKVPLHTYKETG